MVSQLLKQTFVDDYLKRLQYSGPVLPNLQTLKTLQHLHLLNIPFENLSNLLQEKYCTTKEDLYKKIVQGHRGGLCCELNTLFAFLLQDLGYSLIIVEAIVFDKLTKRWLPWPTHQLSIVSLGDEKWIVDVGFGGDFTVPLRFVEDEIQDGETGVNRIRKDLDLTDRQWFIVESTCQNIVNLHIQNKLVDESEDGDWEQKYKFNLIPRSIEHFTNAKNIILKDPSSPFTRGLVCTVLRPWGRITVSRYKLIKKYVQNKKITGKEVKMLKNQGEVMSVLESEFGVKLPHLETPLKLA